MDVVLGTLEEEEAVVVDKLGSTVKMEESGDIRPVLVIDDLRVSCQRLRPLCHIHLLSTYIARLEVEPRGVELECLREVGHARAKVAELVDGRRTLNIG